jgi:hypothetical protein
VHVLCVIINLIYWYVFGFALWCEQVGDCDVVEGREMETERREPGTYDFQATFSESQLEQMVGLSLQRYFFINTISIVNDMVEILSSVNNSFATTLRDPALHPKPTYKSCLNSAFRATAAW